LSGILLKLIGYEQRTLPQVCFTDFILRERVAYIPFDRT